VQSPLLNIEASDEWNELSLELQNEEAKTIIYSSLDGKATQAAGVCQDAHDPWKKVTSI